MFHEQGREDKLHLAQVSLIKDRKVLRHTNLEINFKELLETEVYRYIVWYGSVVFK